MPYGEAGRTLTQVTRTFQHSSAQIPLARLFVREVLARWGLLGVERLVEDVLLVASELVTNAVLHGAGEVAVSLARREDALRLEVCDEGSHWVPRLPDPFPARGLTGRGLRIVDRVASAWGTARAPGGGTVVWAELDRG